MRRVNKEWIQSKLQFYQGKRQRLIKKYSINTGSLKHKQKETFRIAKFLQSVNENSNNQFDYTNFFTLDPSYPTCTTTSCTAFVTQKKHSWINHNIIQQSPLILSISGNNYTGNDKISEITITCSSGSSSATQKVTAYTKDTNYADYYPYSLNYNAVSNPPDLYYSVQKINSGINYKYNDQIDIKQFFSKAANVASYSLKNCSVINQTHYGYSSKVFTEVVVTSSTETISETNDAHKWTLDVKAPNWSFYYNYVCQDDNNAFVVSKSFKLQIKNDCQITSRQGLTTDLMQYYKSQYNIMRSSFAINDYLNATSNNCTQSGYDWCYVVQGSTCDTQKSNSSLAVLDFDTSSPQSYKMTIIRTGAGRQQNQYQCQFLWNYYCSIPFYVYVDLNCTDQTYYTKHAPTLTVYQHQILNTVITDSYVHQTNYSGYFFTPPYYTCDLPTLYASSTNPGCNFDCPNTSGFFQSQASLAQKFNATQSQWYNIAINTKEVMTQLCTLTCNLNSTNTIVSNIIIKIDYPCAQSYTYTQYPLSAQAFGQNQNTGISQLMQQKKEFNDLIRVTAGHYCKIQDCKLATWFNGICNVTFTSTFITQDKDVTWLYTNISTAMTRLPISSCIICQSNVSSQIFQLNTNLTYSVYCNNIVAITPIPPAITSVVSLIQSPGSDNPFYMTLDLSDYFTGFSDPYVCSYYLCGAVSPPATTPYVSWITGSVQTQPTINDTCLFSISTTSIQYSQNLDLQVKALGEIETYAVSSPISFEIKDVCDMLSFTNVTSGTTTIFYENYITLPSITPDISVYQNEFTSSPYNTRTVVMSVYFKRPLTTCEFSTCSLYNSGTQLSCDNTVLTKTSFNSYELKIDATIVFNNHQNCYYQCTITGGIYTVRSQDFKLKVVSACGLASTYTETQPTNLALSQQAKSGSTSNSFSQSWAYSSFVAVKPSYSCEIQDCILYSYSTCSSSLIESWVITQPSTSTAFSATIDTTNAQVNTQFCIKCTSKNLYLATPSNEIVTLANKIDIGICAISVPKPYSSANDLSYIQYYGTAESYNTFLTISSFFTVPSTNACIYNTCSIVASSDTSLSWITGFVYNSLYCTFNLNTALIQSQTSIELYLKTTTTNQINVVNTYQRIEIVDYCYITANYQYPKIVSLTNLNQIVPLVQVTDVVNMSDYIYTAKTHFNFTSCGIYLYNTANACPQAQLTKTSVCADCKTCACNMYSLTRTTAIIQNNTQCMYKCLLHDGLQYVQTQPFYVNVDYSCNRSFALSETQLPALALSQKRYSTNQFTFVKDWTYSSFVSINSGYTCAIKSCNFYSTNSDCNNIFALAQAWLQPLTPSTTSIVTNIDTTIGSGQAYNFCMQCLFEYSNQIYTMTKLINIGICAIKTIKTFNSTIGELIILQYPGSTVLQNVTLNFTDYFDQSTVYPCHYSSCYIYNSSKQDFAWITQTYFTNDSCTFTVKTVDIQYIKDAYLTLSPTDGNQITVQSNPIQMNVTDVCAFIKYYSVIDNQQWPMIKYNMTYLQYFGVNFSYPDQLKINDYFAPPLSKCEYQNCGIVDKDNKTPSWIYNITLLNTICSWQIDTFKITNITQLYLQLIPTLTRGIPISVPMNFTVDESCSKANIQLATSFPSGEEDPYGNYQKVGAIARLMVIVKLGITTTYQDVNITQRFTNSMDKYCPIIKYQIDKVENVETGQNLDNWSTLLRIDEIKGIIKIIDFSLKPTFQVYIKASNEYGAFGGQKDYLLKLMINVNPIIIPEQKPESKDNQISVYTPVVINKIISNETSIVPIIKNVTVIFLDSKNFSGKITQYLLWSDDLKKFLHEDSWELTCNLKPQMPQSNSTQSMLDTAATSAEGFKIIFVAGLVVNALSEGQSQLMFGLMRILQLVLHLPILRTVVPPNVTAFYRTLIPVVMFDLLDMVWQWKDHPQIFVFDEEGQQESTEDILPQLQDLGYQSRNTILNTSTVCIIIWFYYAKIILVIILNLWIYATLNAFNAKRLLKILIKGLFFNQILGLSIEAYLEFCISSLLTLQKPSATTNGEVASQVMAYYMMTTSLVILPALLTFTMGLSKEQLEEISFRKRLKCLYDGIDPRSRYKRAYFLFYCLKRLIFVSISFFMVQKRFESLQLVLVIILNMASMVYVGSAKAFEKRLYNILDILNEQLNSIVGIHMLCYSYYSESPKIKVLIGWSMITFILLMLVVNLGPILYNIARTLKLIFTKYYRKTAKFCRKQWKKYLERCFGKPLNQPETLKQLIDYEKEKLKLEIQYAEEVSKKQLARELGLIIQESLHREHIQKLNEQDRNYRQQKYDEQRDRVISQQSDKEKLQAVKAQKIMGNQVYRVEATVKTMQQAQQSNKTYSQNDIVNALSKNILPPEEFMKVMGIKVPELELQFQQKQQKKSNLRLLMANPKKVINNLNLPVIHQKKLLKKKTKNTSEKPKELSFGSFEDQQFAAHNKQNYSIESDSQSLSISVEETPRFELTNLPREDERQSKLDQPKGKEVFEEVKQQDKTLRPAQKQIYHTNAFYEKSFCVYTCRREEYLPTDHLTLTTLEDLPFTFDLWEQTDYLFKIVDGDNFRKFVANRFAALFEINVRYKDWTKEFQGTEQLMELKKNRVRETIAELRRLWIFESESDEVKLEKFKLVNKMMLDYYKKTKGKQTGDDIIVPAGSPVLAYNCGVSDLASYFKIPRDQFELKKVKLPKN